MAPEASGSSSLASLSQAPSPAPSCLTPSAPPARAPPPVPASPVPSFCLPTPPLRPQFPNTNSLARFPLFSETLPTPFSSELIRTYPFKIKLFGDPEAKPLISYISWTNAELRVTVRDSPKVTGDPHRFAELI